jgi:hypothetical protein
MAGSGPEKIVFVGGAPRSGTTVTHALICTSAAVSDYHPEISFFRGIPQAFRNGSVAWEEHTSAFFDDPEAFRSLMRQTSDLSLDHIWRRLGQSKVMAVKDPHLTPLFPDLARLYPDVGYFVTVLRHPYDVVRSRQEVHEKSGTGRAYSVHDVTGVSREYVNYYRAVLKNNFGGRHFAFRYEDLNADHLQQALAGFVGVDDLFARPMWGKPAKVGDDPWDSPKYNQPIDLEPRLSPLADELREATKIICGPIMERFGYT